MQPTEFFELSAESPAHKAMQTRLFETDNEKELLSASAAVLQDLGFQVEDVVREVGMLRAAKERSAREHGQEAAMQAHSDQDIASAVGAHQRARVQTLPMDLATVPQPARQLLDNADGYF